MTLMRHMLPAALPAGLFTSQASAATYDLDFAGDICTATPSAGRIACTNTNNGLIDQTYGDVEGVVDVIYNRVASSAVSDGEDRGRLLHWTFVSTASSFGGLPNAAYGVSGDALSIFFKPLNGKSVTLNNFYLGIFGGDRGLNLTISDGLGAALFSEEIERGLSGLRDYSTPGGWSSTNGIRISYFGGPFWPGANFVGISNINFSVTDVATPSDAQIPLPAAGWLMVAGLGALATLRRRRKA